VICNLGVVGSNPTRGSIKKKGSAIADPFFFIELTSLRNFRLLLILSHIIGYENKKKNFPQFP
ncbi:hypothetical protein, partial [Bacteroides fragilis]